MRRVSQSVLPIVLVFAAAGPARAAVPSRDIRSIARAILPARPCDLMSPCEGLVDLSDPEIALGRLPEYEEDSLAAAVFLEITIRDDDELYLPRARIRLDDVPIYTLRIRGRARGVARILHTIDGTPPVPGSPKITPANGFVAKDDGRLDIAEPIHLLSSLFGGGLPPAPPFPDCDVSPRCPAAPCPR